MFASKGAPFLTVYRVYELKKEEEEKKIIQSYTENFLQIP